MYLSSTPQHWACDIEADDLRNEATVIHCVCVLNLQTKAEQTFTDAASFRAWLEDETRILVGHNFLAYDAPVLNRLWQAGIPVSRVVDTMVLSQMFNANIGGHGLDAWGERLGYAKGDHTDFSRYTPEMLKYCQRDVRLTALLFLKLTERMRREGFSELSCELEHQAWHIIQNKQKQNGFPFDLEKADLLYAELREREAQLKAEIYRLWPPVLQIVRRFAKSRKSDGTRTANYQRHLGEYPKLEDNPDGSYNAYDYVEFDLGSPQQRIQKLLDFGWKPVNFTKKGAPKVDEEEMLAFAESSGIPEVAALAKWCVVNSRANMVRTWITAVNPKTGNIHGSLFLASTGRYKHSSPNTANIPGVKTGPDDHPILGEPGTWAYECRSLWTGGGPGWRLVGIDGKGMQLRCLAHNVAKIVGPDVAAEFIRDVLTGDPHKRNQERLGLANKPAAKKFLYCVPFDSEALTRRGWKKQWELIPGEEILTYNAETNKQEWQPLIATHTFDSGPIIEMGHSHGFRVRSTPNHRWFTQQRKGRLKNNELPIEVRETQELTTMQNIIVNAPLVGDDESCGYDWTSLPKYQTDWVQVVLDMSQQERRAFLAGFCIADGYWHKGEHWCWNQLSGNLADAAHLASYLVSDGVCRISKVIRENGKEETHCSIGKKPHVTTASFEYSALPEEPVWCPETPNHSWVMRQGSVITITGNTTLMGGGGAKLAVDQAQFGTHLTAAEGNKLKDMLIDGIPGFRDLINHLQRELRKTGRITLCDGHRLIVPSDHMVIPYLLQGDESRIMKKAMILTDQAVRRAGLAEHVLKVGDIHDESQYRVREECVDDFVGMALGAFPEAGEFFDYLIRIEGDCKVGNNWSETH